MAEITIVTLNLVDLDLTDEERELFEAAMPDEPVDWAAILTDEKVAEAMVAAGLVAVH